MRTETVNNIQEAEQLLSKYHALDGVIHPDNNKKIWTVFVGISDETVSMFIYGGIRGTHSTWMFQQSDLSILEFWAGFDDDTIVRLSEVLRYDDLKKICEPGGLYHEIEVSSKWSNPISIPKGLAFRIIAAFANGLVCKIFDSIENGISGEHSLHRENGINKLIRYEHDYHQIDKMSNPAISFKLVNDTHKSLGISLAFVNE